MALHDREVEIRRPCPVKLSPDRIRDGSRSWYCGHCEKSVHVLSNMTESEARGFLAERVGQDLCVTYAVRRDGSIRFRPERSIETIVPVSVLRRRRAAAAVGLGMALAACAPHDHPKVQRSEIELADRPVGPMERPIVPDAPEEVVVDGGLRWEPDPDERLVDGEIEPTPITRGEIAPAPLPIRAGGIRPMPIDPPHATPDEPGGVDKAEPTTHTSRRGRIRPRL